MAVVVVVLLVLVVVLVVLVVVVGVDSALYASGIQLQSQRMEFHQANQLTDQSQRENSWLCNELEMRDKAFQEDRARRYREIEEKRKICCAEAEGDN